MARAEISDLFNCTVVQFYRVLTDYQKYPEFLSEVKSCEVIQAEGARKLVEYEIKLIRRFRYRLWMSEIEPSSVAWEFASGDLFRATHGVWQLDDVAGKVRVRYCIDAKFRLFTPAFIADAVLHVNLPSMMSSYHRRVADLYHR